MTHRSSDQAAARMNCPLHTGASKAIRAELARAGEPLSVDRLVLATGLERKKVLSMLGQMVDRTGQVVALQGPKSVVYTLYRNAPKVKPEQPAGAPFAVAGPITIGRGSNWKAGFM